MTTLGEKLREAIEKKAIQSTLNAWDEHEDQIRKPQTQEKEMANPNPVVTITEGKQGFGVSNNVVRATFNAVKNAPKMYINEYIQMLELSGFKPNSTSAVLYQLMRSGQVERDINGQLSVTVDEYIPIKQAKKKKPPRTILLDKAPEPKPRQIVIVKKPSNKSEGIAALKADTAHQDAREIVAKMNAKAFHPSAIVDGLTVLHARELYDYLKKIFGGN